MAGFFPRKPRIRHVWQAEWSPGEGSVAREKKRTQGYYGIWKSGEKKKKREKQHSREKDPGELGLKKSGDSDVTETIRGKTSSRGIRDG